MYALQRALETAIRELRITPKTNEWNTHYSANKRACMHEYMNTCMCMCKNVCVRFLAVAERKNSPLPSRANTAKAESRKMPEGERERMRVRELGQKL